MTNDQTVTQALEPCPMCGAEEQITSSDNGPVYCRKCGLRALSPEHWNTRTAHSGEGRSNGAGEKWGPPISLGGKRPDWLDGNETLMSNSPNMGFYIGPARMAIIDYLTPPIRLRADHPIYAALSSPQGEVEREGALLVLDRLHRGDVPRMVPMTTVQGGRLIFTNRADVDVFIEAYRRGDNAASFTVHEVPRIDVRIFWQSCRDHDWHYANSDDLRVYREGGAVASQLAVQQTISREHRRIYQHWKKHHETGPAYGTVRHPAPEEPALSQPEAGGER